VWYFSYTKQEMDMEIQRVARELYKALSGMNEEFEQVRIPKEKKYAVFRIYMY
jgi:hypothetical protein